jgi:large repetitive protein
MLDRITNARALTFSGTAPPGATVRLYQDSVPIGTTTSNASGAWSFNYSGTNLAEGTYAFTARSELARGKRGKGERGKGRSSLHIA